MGTHGPVPSNTSRYTSADIGLIHMVGLDLNTLDPAQLAWLEADLARANENRTRTPWIMVASHFPLFHSVTSAHANMSAAYGTFRPNFHHFDRLELDLRGHTRVWGAAFSGPRFKWADVVLI